MEIKKVNKMYFQKSKLFLYPVLGINKGQSISLIETYTGWKDHIESTDKKLLCLYHLRKDPEFVKFEKTKLLANKYFTDFIEFEEDKGLYVFDLQEYKDDWEHFLNGKYSKLSQRLKTQVVSFQPKNTVNYSYVNSFVYPEKYFGVYTKLLDTSLELLVKVGELCDPPDLEKEVLCMNTKSLDIPIIIT